jgi:glycosyltransferase involved in cell wall biosynthesis
LRQIARHHLKFYVRHRFSRLDLQRSRAVERRLLSLCDEAWFSSADEYERYAGMVSDVTRLEFRPRHFQPSAARRRSDAPTFHVGFLGSPDVMNLDALVYFRDAILPSVRSHVEDVRWLVAGGIAAKAAELLRDVPNVTIWPSLPDVAAFYDAIELMVAPLRFGTGTCIKVLEGVAFGCPIVSTSVGVRGIPPEHLRGVTVSDDPTGFASLVSAQLRGAHGGARTTSSQAASP